MNKYKVEGRIRADIPFEEIVEARNEISAAKKAEKIVYARCGITAFDVLDDEIYCEQIKEATC